MATELGKAALIHFLGKKVFRDYEPCQFEPFENRFAGWLANVESEEERRILQDILLNIFYVGRKEFESLYRSLYGGIISNWTVEQEGLDLFDIALSEKIHQLVNLSWVCPVTDSLRINAFLKVNSLISKPYRPDWQSLAKFGDLKKIRAYAETAKVKKLILLEDFVGSGTQSKNAVAFAAAALPDAKILFCPLVVCPAGDRALNDLAAKTENLTYEPCLVLPQSAMVGTEPMPDEPPLHSDIRKLVSAYSDRFEGQDLFGFKDTGALVVLYSNCPNNTIPVIHHASESWASLFPRVRRA